MRTRLLFLAALAFVLGIDCSAQNAPSPCPQVLIDQKYDHIVSQQCQQEGWDTLVTCQSPSITLTSEPYIPTKFFNGTYTVEEIPYNPPDTSFYLGGQGQRLPPISDDRFECQIDIPFPFYFFGIRKNQFSVSTNGVVTFTNGITPNAFCPWNFSSGIPWTVSTAGAPDTNYFAQMHDAIYGIYQDIVHSNYCSGNQGVFYGIVDSFPCRKIICSWNDVPYFNTQTARNTYQIVCYEGTNIVEVHIKQRRISNTWMNGLGIIGIQNATGEPQVQGSPGSSNAYVVPGSPAAFWPNGHNPTISVFDTVAFRFTPQGTQQYYYKWYRIFDDGQDSVDLAPFATTDTNGHFIPMGSDTTHPTLTQAVVSPRCASRYVMELRFENADGDMYTLRDTISIGYNQYTTLHAPDTIEIHDTTLIELPATGDIPANHEIHDTTFVTLYDTLAATSTWCDTILVQCQCIIHDTLYVSTEKIDESAVFEGTIRFINGQIVVENAGQNTVALYDAAGRQLAVRRNEGAPILFDVPASGTYLVKVGSAPARRIVVVK